MPRNQREKEEEKSQIKLSPKQVPGSVGEAMVCYALAQAAQVVVDPKIFPVLERLYDAEVSSGDTNPNNEVRAQLTRIHEQLYDAVAAAGFEMCDLCEVGVVIASRGKFAIAHVPEHKCGTHSDQVMYNEGRGVASGH